LAAGLFDTLFRRGEDVELAYRLRDLGLHFRFLPDALIDHRPHRTFGGWQNIALQYGHYDVLMWRTKGREHILSLIGHEFKNDRPKSLQLAARTLVGRRNALDLLVGILGISARAGALAGLKRFTRPAFSAIFNLLYWQGVAEALGGREIFLASVVSGSSSGHSPPKTQHAG
jgi:GT2 family glycosyltransferase